MSNWIDAINESEIPNNQHQVVVLEGLAIAIFNIDNCLYAIEDCCTHQGLPLSDGFLAGTEITCPFHGAKFCLKTGNYLSPPAFENLKTFETRVYAGKIQLNFEAN